MAISVLGWLSAAACGADRRLANGVTYEPETFVERRNWIADKLRHTADVVTMHPRHSEQPLTNIAVARVAVDSLSEAAN